MQNLENKTILITGGTGFIGSRLAERLVIEEKAKVTVLVNSWSKATWVSRLNVKLVQGNILDANLLEEVSHGIDIIFHCVGIGGTMEECMRTNVDGTRLVLEAALKNKVNRIVYFSSVVVTGAHIPDGLNENFPFNKTGNPYADSKIEAEKLFLDFVKTNEIEGTVIRPTYVWGPTSPYYTIDVIQQMKADTFQVVDHGAGICNAVYIDNLVDLALVCSYHQKAINQVFLATDNEKISWKDFYSFYARMLNKDFLLFKSIPSRSNLIRKFGLNFKSFLIRRRQKLTEKVNKYSAKHIILTKIFFKAPRKVTKVIIRKLDNLFPEMDTWDLETYSSKGLIDVSKASDILGFTPKISISDGMKACEKSLKFQHFL